MNQNRRKLMKQIGILLTSPKEVGGIYQYSLSVIEALNLLYKKKKFKIRYYYSDKHWEKELPKKADKVFIYKGIIKKIIRKIIYSIIEFILLIQLFLIFLNAYSILILYIIF